jgi:predicted SAM-dependent methyltransferase
MSSPKVWPNRLHLGCGLTTPKGWLNVDGSWQVVLANYPVLKRFLVAARLLPKSQAMIPWNPAVMRLNLVRPLPFPNESFEVVYCSHTLEHLHHEEALTLLKECHRVLKPAGICRVVVPDLAAIVERYLNAKKSGDTTAGTRFMEELLVHDKHRKRGLLGLYYRMTAYHQHKWMYDAQSMQRLFEIAGFEQVAPAQYRVSRIDGISEIEDANRILNGQGVAIEAIKQ